MSVFDVHVRVLSPNPKSIPGESATQYISEEKQSLRFKVEADTPSLAKKRALKQFEEDHPDRFFVRASYPISRREVLLVVMKTCYLPKARLLTNIPAKLKAASSGVA